MSSQKNIGALQMLRAIAAIAVVLWHSRLATKHTAIDYWPEMDAAYRAQHYPAYLNHLDLGVDVFFCISGFIMCMLVQKSASGSEALWRFIAQRAIRILPPYWFFSILVVIAYLASAGRFNVGQLSGDHLSDLHRFSTSILLIPQNKPPILGVGWTLIHEFIFYITCGLTIVLGLNRWLPQLLAFLALVSIGLAMLDVVVAFGYLLSTFTIEFLFGALSYQFASRRIIFPVTTLVAGAACFLVVSQILDNGLSQRDTHLVRSIGGGLMGVLLIIGLIGVDRKYELSSFWFGKLLMRIGDASYTLYLAHWFILSIMGKLIGQIPGAPFGAVAAWHALSILTAIAISIVIAEKLELPFHRFLLNGFRMSR